MKEFENESMNPEMNEQGTNEVKNDTVNTDTAQTDSVVNDNRENYDNIEAKNEAPQQTQQNDPIRDNPYFRGYSQPSAPNYQYTNPQTNNTQPQYTNQQNTQPQNTNQPNTQQNNPYWRETPYRSNPYSNQSQGYGQSNNGQSNNGQSAPQYNRPAQSDGQISYTPTANSSKKQKSGKSVSKGVVAVACAATIVLSGCFGFGGAMLANSINSNKNVQSTAGNSHVVDSSDPVVIYKSVEDIATSTGNTGENLNYTQVAAMVKDSVVEIVTEFNNQSIWYQYVTTGAGSGVIISTDGYIITNAHVITDESGSTVADNIIVRLTDSSEHTAQIVAYDSDSDIAILKIEAEGLTPAQCGDSDKLAVGEELVVVGNPLGELGGSVTNGIVSATEREIPMGGVTMHLIQTNAAVNPGNSGGGMFNMKGQLVGIINAKSSGTGIEGLGFAIPINSALDVAEQLLEYGYVRGKTMIGVSFQDVSNNNYYYFYNVKAGVYVAELTEGYNDDVLKVGDRVIAVNGEEISSSEDIKAVVTSCSVGDKIKFQLYRDNKLMEVEVTCYEKVPTETSEIQFEEEQQSGFVDGDGNVFTPDENSEGYSTYSGNLPDWFSEFFGGN